MGFKWLARCFAVASVALFATALFATRPAEAGGLKAKVVLTQAKIPDKLTEKGLLGFATSHSAKILRESTEAKLDERKWKANLVISFNAPVGDLEFQVLFYDVHDGPRRFVEDLATFVNDRKQKTFVQPIALPRPRFAPNRNMELVVTVRRQEVARLKFGVDGEEKKRSGTVSFGDNER
jgi:hypothetical protein